MSDIQPAERHADIGDAAIGYLEYESEGPPLLLLHATGFLPWLWHPVARELAGTYHVIAPYVCDYRNADPESGGFGWKQIAADLLAFCRDLEIRNPFVVGHSMGGAVPVIAAGALGMAFAQMVLIEPILLPEGLYEIDLNVADHPLAAKAISPSFSNGIVRFLNSISATVWPPRRTAVCAWPAIRAGKPPCSWEA